MHFTFMSNFSLQQFSKFTIQFMPQFLSCFSFFGGVGASEAWMTYTLCCPLTVTQNCRCVCRDFGIVLSGYVLNRDTLGNCFFLRTEISLKGATYQISFTDTDQLPPPFRIDNISEVSRCLSASLS